TWIGVFLIIFLMATGASAQRRSSKTSGKTNRKESSSKAASAKTTPAGSPVVSRVISGDLLELASGERVRLIGADAPVMPERNKPGQEPWASEARRFTEKLALGKEITINNLG